MTRDNRSLERISQSIMRIRASEKRLDAENKKKLRQLDAHNKIVMGGVILAVLRREFEEGDDRRLLYFLKMQERNGHYFTKAMNRRDLEENKNPNEGI